MVGWHHQLNGHEFQQTLGDSEGQGSLVCCSSWGRKELDTTEATQEQQQLYTKQTHNTFSSENLKSSVNILTENTSGISKTHDMQLSVLAESEPQGNYLQCGQTAFQATDKYNFHYSFK